MLELPRTNPETDKRIYVVSPHFGDGVMLVVNSKSHGQTFAASLNAQEVDNLIVMLQYAKKVVIEEGGVLD